MLKNAKYDLLLYIPIEIPLEDDGRSMNIEFQRKIDNEYKNFLDSLGLGYKEIKGTIPERVSAAKKAIEKHKKQYS